MEVETAILAGHCVKRLAAAAGEDGGPEGRPIRIDDCENTTLEGKTSGSGSDETVAVYAPDSEEKSENVRGMHLQCG